MKSEFKKVYDLIGETKTIMLTTLNEDGALHSRPMNCQDMDEEGNLWFFTSSPTGKTADIEVNRQVNMAYALPKDGSYVSIAGTAELVTDKEKIKELWKPILKAWFPEGIEQPDLALLKVKMDSAEFWDEPKGKMVEMFKVVKAAISGEGYHNDASEHGRANFNRN